MAERLLVRSIEETSGFDAAWASISGQRLEPKAAVRAADPLLRL
jgi:hypothetical protein